MTFSLHGLGVSGGYAIGRAQLFSHDRLEAPHYVLQPEHLEEEVARFEAAVEEVRAEFATLREHIPEGAPAELSAFLDLHSLILDDSMLSEVPKHCIREGSCNAEWALAQQTEGLIAQFEAIEDEITPMRFRVPALKCLIATSKVLAMMRSFSASRS